MFYSSGQSLNGPAASDEAQDSRDLQLLKVGG